MLAYKFRPSEKLDWIVEIVTKRRLHCSDWSGLNDPLEGRFYYSEDYSQRLAPLVSAKNRLRVCALSKTFRSRLLWAHYANGFDGVAIEIDLPKRDLGTTFYDVVYQSRNPEADLHDDETPGKKARYILRHKHTDWAYEEEVRIIQKDEYYGLSKPIVKIIVGRRFNVARLQDLRLVCEENRVALITADLGAEGVLIT